MTCLKGFKVLFGEVYQMFMKENELSTLRELYFNTLNTAQRG